MCLVCAQIERVLSKQDGVSDAVVNFAGMEARATVAPGTDIAGLQAAIGKIGYDIHPLAPGEERVTPTERYSKETAYQQRNVILAAIFTLPLMILSMAVTESDATRLWQWILATPVVFVFGWQFHRAAAKQIATLGPAMDSLISIGSLAAYGYSVYTLTTTSTCSSKRPA